MLLMCPVSLAAGHMHCDDLVTCMYLIKQCTWESMRWLLGCVFSKACPFSKTFFVILGLE